MKLTLLHKILSFQIFAKAIAFKKGSLGLLSMPLSIGFLGAIKKLIKNVDEFDLVLPIITIGGCVFLYFLFFIADFVWGLIAAKHQSKKNPDWVESDKLYSSLGKIGGVLLIDVLLIAIILFLVIIGFVKISVAFLIITVMLNVLAIMYEIHSIGENIKRRTGKKPAYLSFFDKITSVLENRIITKIENQLD